MSTVGLVWILGVFNGMGSGLMFNKHPAIKLLATIIWIGTLVYFILAVNK